MRIATKPAPTATNFSDSCIEQTPFPMATVERATHILTYVNPAFCQLADKAEQDLLGKPFHEVLGKPGECLARLNRVYRSGKPESYTEQEQADPRSVLRSYTMWPVMADEPAICIMIREIETDPIYERTVAMNEALVIGSLRQHELAAVATLSNTQLQTEAGSHKQRELDAWMLTNEISHRIKNNLQMVVGLIGHEAKRAGAPTIQGYESMQARIGAIAQLYDLMSHSSHNQSVALDAYLGEIAKALSASLLKTGSGITIEAESETVDIDPKRAVPFGLLVNGLVTNAIKHAFPGGTGSVVLGAHQIGDRIELTVADDGVGMKDRYSVNISKKHGADYVAMFVRQLGGTLALLQSDGTGTIVSIQFPLRADA